MELRPKSTKAWSKDHGPTALFAFDFNQTIKLYLYQAAKKPQFRQALGKFGAQESNAW